MPSLELNSTRLDAEAGTTILEAARACGVDIPTLCYDPRLKPAGDCRLCLVEVEGIDHPVPSCTTPVSDGMRVRADTAALQAFRAQMLAWMAKHVSQEAFEAWPDKELHKLLRAYQIAPQGMAARKKDCDLSHPYIRVDMSQCIDCYRCVRICADVQGQFVWHAINRGEETRIVPDSGTTLATSSCVGCGACVDSCPSAALTDRVETESAKVERWTRTTCVYCGVGCEVEIGTRQDRIVRTRPVLNAPVSKGHLCIKGRYAFGFVDAPDRMLDPMVREGRRWQRASWSDALDHTASELQRICPPMDRAQSASWALRERPMRRTISLRNSRGLSLGPTMSIPARGCAIRPRQPP